MVKMRSLRIGSWDHFSGWSGSRKVVPEAVLGTPENRFRNRFPGYPGNRPKPAFCEKQCFQRPTKRNRTRIRESRLLFRSLPVWSKTRFKVLGRFGRFPGPPKPPFPGPQKEGVQGGFGTLELAVPWDPGKWFRTANSSPPDRASKPLIPEVGREGGNGRFHQTCHFGRVARIQGLGIRTEVSRVSSKPQV